MITIDETCARRRAWHAAASIPVIDMSPLHSEELKDCFINDICNCVETDTFFSDWLEENYPDIESFNGFDDLTVLQVSELVRSSAEEIITTVLELPL